MCGHFLFSHYLPLAFFPAAFAFGVLGTNCLPALVPARFLRLVAAYSALLKDFMAAEGR